MEMKTENFLLGRDTLRKGRRSFTVRFTFLTVQPLNMKLGSLILKRQLKWWNLLFGIVGCCFMVGLYLGESTFRFYSFSLDLINEIVDSDAVYVNLPTEFDDFLKTCNHFSLQLVVLDRNVLSCLLNGTACSISNETTIYRFGFFEESNNNAERLANNLAKSNHVRSKYKNNYLFEINELQFALMSIEKRPKYWFIADLPTANISAFALLHPANLISANLNNRAKLLVPTPMDLTIRQLEMSKFMECNQTTSKQLHKTSPYLFQIQPLINDKHLEDMAYMRDLLHSVRMFPFLFGGTALGWYRECGIIPYTTDLDFAALASEYDVKLENILKNDKRLKLYWILGKPDDSLELSVYTGKMKIDLFMVYENETTTWVGGMMDRHIVAWYTLNCAEKLNHIHPANLQNQFCYYPFFKWTYPKIKEFCTADLKGHLFNVPCNIEDILISDYGQFWYKPHHESKFLWHSSHKNVVRNGVWSNREWMRVYRVFYKQM